MNKLKNIKYSSSTLLTPNPNQKHPTSFRNMLKFRNQAYGTATLLPVCNVTATQTTKPSLY